MAEAARIRNFHGTSFASGIASLYVGTAFAGAQPAPDPASNASTMAVNSTKKITHTSSSQSSQALTEVIVTAQRREARISKVPLAITAFNAAQLAQRSIHTETDLQSNVPGLTVKTGESASQINFAIRGQTLDVASGSSPGVLVYLNDVQLESHSSGSFYDLSSVQVLKGPQGTLFGRNDVGGAVLYTTTQPTDIFGGYLTVRAGDYHLGELEGAVDISLVPDKVALRLAGDTKSEQGYTTNLMNGDRLGDVNHNSVRATLRVDPTPYLRSTFLLSYTEDGGTELNGELYSAYAVGQTHNGYALNSTAAEVYGPRSLGSIIAGTPAGIIAYLKQQEKQGIYNERLPFTPQHRAHEIFFSNTTTYDIAPGMELKNIASASTSVTRADTNLSGSPFGILQLYDVHACCDGIHYNDDQWSEELQLQGGAGDSKLKYIFGLYAASTREGLDFPVAFGADLPTPIAALHYNTVDQDYSEAIFAQATYDLSGLTTVRGLSATGGFRWTEEQVSLVQGTDSIFYGGPKQSASKGLPSWQLGLNYQVTPALLIYFVNRGSWRSGNFNGNAPPTNDFNEFRPERTIDYEVGSKFNGHLFDRPVHLDIALYSQISHDVQRDVYLEIEGAPASFTRNVPRASTKGVEFDGEVRALPWLTLGGALAYSNAVYTAPIVSAYGQTLIFSSFPDTPRWTGSLYVQLDLPAPDAWGGMSLRGETYAQTRQFFTSLASSIEPGTELPGYTLINLRYDWKQIFHTHASITAFATNLLNRGYFQGGFANGPSAGINIASPGPPRMFGAEVNYTF